MSEALHPTEGIRVRLRRRNELDSGAADYVGEVFTPASCFEYRALLKSDGAVDLEAIGDSAEPEDEKQLRNIAASIARAAARNREQGLPPWPTRVVRWRAKRS